MYRSLTAIVIAFVVGFVNILAVAPLSGGNYGGYYYSNNYSYQTYQAPIIAPAPYIIEVPAFRFKYEAAPQGIFNKDELKEALQELLPNLIQPQSPVTEDNLNPDGDDGPPMAENPNEIVYEDRSVGRGNDIEVKAINILSNRCAGCHTGATAKGKFQIFSAAGRLNKSVSKFDVWESVDESRMPKQAQKDPKAKLPASEIATLRAWYKQSRISGG